MHDPTASDIGPALEKFVQMILDTKVAIPSTSSQAPSNFKFLLPLPSRGSACKRLNLFLRWMVRPDDGIDFGIWKKISPSQLIIPLDTHVARIARRIGLTRRTSADWKTALEVTHALRQLDSADPVKYDFAICKLGMLGICPARHDPAKCAACSLNPFCRLIK
jgi:uncharacterized protein (TIGR02757 family)